MEENKPELPPDETAGAEPQENISLSDAMTGVLTEPGTTFESVKLSSKKNYWIVPVIISIVLYIAASMIAMRDSDLSSEIKMKQKTAANERLDKAVKDGKMSREDADAQREKMEKFMDQSGPLFYVFAILGPLFAGFIFLFARAGIFIGVFKIFKGTASFSNILSVLGLASVIEIIQVIVDTVLAIVRGKLMSNIGPGLLVTSESVGENMFKFLSHFDVLAIWYLVVLGIGFAKVSNLKVSQTLPVVFLIWLIYVLATSFLNLGIVGM
jgi:hypothetical protein